MTKVEDSSERPEGSASHQFTPGQSGNPKGRPKGKKNRKAIVQAIGRETHVVATDGGARRYTNAELLFVALKKMALQGNRRAAKLLDKYNDRFSPSEIETSQYGVLVVPAPVTIETTTLPIEDVEDDDDPVRDGEIGIRKDKNYQ